MTRSLTGAMKLGRAWLLAEAHVGVGCIVAVGDATKVAVMVLGFLLADCPSFSCSY